MTPSAVFALWTWNWPSVRMTSRRSGDGRIGPRAGPRTGGEGTRRLVPHTGFEPVISALRGRCPGPLDECGAGGRGRRAARRGGQDASTAHRLRAGATAGATPGTPGSRRRPARSCPRRRPGRSASGRRTARIGASSQSASRSLSGSGNMRSSPPPMTSCGHLRQPVAIDGDALEHLPPGGARLGAHQVLDAQHVGEGQVADSGAGAAPVGPPSRAARAGTRGAAAASSCGWRRRRELRGSAGPTRTRPAIVVALGRA